MGHLGPPKPPFLVWIKKNNFTNNLYLGYGTPMPKFQNNPVIFLLI